MKNLFLFTLTFMFCSFLSLDINGQNLSQSEIGTVKGDKYIITLNKSTLKTQWESLLNNDSEDNIQLDIEEAQILYRDGAYNLVAKSMDGSSSSAIELILKDNNLFAADPKVSITCTGCPNGCHPKVVDGKGTCSSCPNFGGTCTKKETLSF